MKIAMCQINPILGDFSNNLLKIKSYYKKAEALGAELIVFPEMAVCGYPPLDLIWESGFVASCEKSIESITSSTKIPFICGYIRQDGGRIFNSAVICQHGRIDYIYDKILLPTYDVFDEKRYFTPGDKVGIFPLKIGKNNYKIGVQICEDLWDEDYNLNITETLVKHDSDFIINISASPFHDKQLENRVNLIRKKVNETHTPFYYCNMVGAQDELIFDGNSLAFDKHGHVIGKGKSFTEHVVFIDTNSPNKVPFQQKCREEDIYSALCLGVRDYLCKTGHQKIVLGLSGGIDSSLTATIAVDALGNENVFGVSMPSELSSNHSKVDAKNLAKNLGIQFTTIPINSIVSETNQALSPIFSHKPKNVAEENIQARIRGMILMGIANKNGWLVLTTGNKTELALGYCTLYGDMNGGLAVISDLSKKDVYSLSHWVNETAGFDRIPSRCISKPPSAELAPNQTDPFDYDEISPMVDSIITNGMGAKELLENGIEKSIVNDITNRIRINEYKRRQAAPGLRVSSKAFGIGRRFPIVNRFKS
jgi:NAD+ synthase (glutamine-hydrolysing)